jgi:hypothetical protein
MTQVRMRKDLADDDMEVPACFTYTDYDNMVDEFWLTADDLEDAEMYDNGENTDNHAFNVVKLRDGRVVYMVGADLEWLSKGEWV